MKGKLGNPVVYAAAINILPTLLKGAIIIGAGYYVYNRFFGFKKQKENPNYRPSNITYENAKQKAENLYNAMFGLSDGYSGVLANLKGVNYNGFIRISNAFGERRGLDLQSGNLVAWLHSNLSEEKMTRLRILTNINF